MRNHRIKSLSSLLTFILVALAGSSGVACGGGGEGFASPTAPATSPSAAQVEFDSFDLVNRSRAEHLVEPQLGLQVVLADLARRHSEAMRDHGFLGHTDPTGSNLRARLRAAGVSFSRAGENIAKVTHLVAPAALAHSQLMNSEEHRQNILNEKYEVAGVGVARSGNTFWITQVYLEP